MWDNNSFVALDSFGISKYFNFKVTLYRDISSYVSLPGINFS